MEVPVQGPTHVTKRKDAVALGGWSRLDRFFVSMPRAHLADCAPDARTLNKEWLSGAAPSDHLPISIAFRSAEDHSHNPLTLPTWLANDPEFKALLHLNVTKALEIQRDNPVEKLAAYKDALYVTWRQMREEIYHDEDVNAEPDNLYIFRLIQAWRSLHGRGCVDLATLFQSSAKMRRLLLPDDTSTIKADMLSKLEKVIISPC